MEVKGPIKLIYPFEKSSYYYIFPVSSISVLSDLRFSTTRWRTGTLKHVKRIRGTRSERSKQFSSVIIDDILGTSPLLLYRILISFLLFEWETLNSLLLLIINVFTILGSKTFDSLGLRIGLRRYMNYKHTSNTFKKFWNKGNTFCPYLFFMDRVPKNTFN